VIELSFSAVILAGSSSPQGEEQGKAGLEWARELFYDAGIETVILAPGLPPGRKYSVGQSNCAGSRILNSAASLTGTHLLVLDPAFSRVDPVFIIRLMQMSCLGMGVLPYCGGVSVPLLACYPLAIRMLEKIFPNPDNVTGVQLAEMALEKGLVARYDVPEKDAIYFSQTVPVLAA